MKSLTEYIFNEFKDSTKLNIQNELELHFYSEFILNESIKYSYFNIFEKNGSYIGQKKLLIDLSKELYNIIRNHEPENTIQLDKKDLRLKFRGSSNQRIIDVKKSLDNNKINLYIDNSNILKGEV